jgi:hypothetical protein
MASMFMAEIEDGYSIFLLILLYTDKTVRPYNSSFHNLNTLYMKTRDPDLY